MTERAAIPLLLLLGAIYSRHSDAGRPEPATPRIEAFTLDSNAAEDRVSASVSLEKDGLPDWRFTATVHGRVSALILTVCTGGAHTISQWDTLPAGVRAPKGFHWKDGGPTWVLGVADRSGKLLNAKDGSISLQAPDEKRELYLHAAQNGFLKSGATVCLSAIGADGTVVARAETKLP